MLWAAVIGTIWAANPVELGPLGLRDLGWEGDPAHHSPLAADFPSPYATPDDLPDVVRIRAPYQSFNNHHYYALVNGRIWEKERVKTETGQPETVTDATWHLMEGTGLPHRPKKRGDGEQARFVPVGWILAIVADDDEIIALGANQRVYFKRLYPTRRFDDRWYDLWGFPIRGRFYWPDDKLDFKGWGVGRRRLDSTGYFSDVDGNEHVSGFGITTTYILDADGHTIWYADTGLPPRMSHRMCGPERGRVISENLDASASTMMLIDRHGNIWTRLADYDTQGGTPGHRYSYERVGLDDLDPFDPRTIDTNMSLPAEPWIHHPSVALEGQGAISQEITILQTGLGNDARELRVVGRGPGGELGYYWKALLDESWQFQATPLSLAEIRWLDPAELGGTPDLAPSEDFALRGQLDVKGVGLLDVHIPDFNLTCTPATVNVSVGDSVLPLELHLVDAWTPFREPDPGYDGTPKGSLGTLVLPEGAADSADPAVQELIAALEPHLLDTYGVWVEANDGYVEFSSVGFMKRGDTELLAATSGTTAEEVKVGREAALVHTRWIEAASDPGLILADPSTAFIGQLEAALAANIALKERLQDLKAKQEDKRAGSLLLSGTMIGVNVVMRATGIRLAGRIGDKMRPKVKRPTKVGVWFSKVAYVLENTASMVIRATKKDAQTLRAMRPDYRMAMDILGERIRAYQAELNRR